MKLKNYSVVDTKFWTGRIDDLIDIDSFRMHQIIQLLDLTDLKSLEIDLSKLNICFIGFCCDEGIKRNLGHKGAKHGPEYIRQEFANLPVTFGNDVAISYTRSRLIVILNTHEKENLLMGIFKKSVIQKHLNNLDKEIDQMVYKLYGLKEEEIKIVEEAK